LTRKGYYLDEVTSALQKEIRRCKEYEAVYWALELESFNYKALWNRLKVIASEDVGLANPIAPMLVNNLEASYLKAKEKEKGESALFVVNAALFLARSPKSRMVGNLLIAVSSAEKRLEMPDYAIDKHTIRGRKMGRGLEHFFAEGAKTENQAFKDPYEDKAKKILKKKKT
jgi:replication-associated recombination protein RarA